jgi:hypothetical protein
LLTLTFPVDTEVTDAVHASIVRRTPRSVILKLHTDAPVFSIALQGNAGCWVAGPLPSCDPTIMCTRAPPPPPTLPPPPPPLPPPASRAGEKPPQIVQPVLPSPTGMSVLGSKCNSVHVTWHPARFMDIPADSYRLTALVEGRASSTLTSETVAQISDLIVGQRYQFYVEARWQATWSPHSTTVEHVVARGSDVHTGSLQIYASLSAAAPCTSLRLTLPEVPLCSPEDFLSVD